MKNLKKRLQALRKNLALQMNNAEKLNSLEELLKLKNELKIRNARKSFFAYCNQKASDFYKPNRLFLVDFCNQQNNLSFLTCRDEAAY